MDRQSESDNEEVCCKVVLLSRNQEYLRSLVSNDSVGNGRTRTVGATREASRGQSKDSLS